jgi:hypothetical protein
LKIVPDEREEDRKWDKLIRQPHYFGLGDLLEESRYR